MALRKIFKAKNEVRGGGDIKSQTGNHNVCYWPIHQTLLRCKNVRELGGWTRQGAGGP